jgi:hypothetical protein
MATGPRACSQGSGPRPWEPTPALTIWVHPMRISHRLEIQGLLIASLAMTGCVSTDTDPEAETCDEPGADCGAEEGFGGAYARACIITTDDEGTQLNQCRNVCAVGDRTPDHAPGSLKDGDLCEYDQDCGEGLACANDEVGGASCRCEVFCETDLRVGLPVDGVDSGGNVGLVDYGPEHIWQVRKTCGASDKSWCDADEGGQTIVLQDTSDPTMVWVLEGTLDGETFESNEQYEGRLCGTTFTGARLDGVDEAGSWTFSSASQFEFETSGTFGGAEFRCQGHGQLGDTTPAEPLSCEAL